MGSMPESIPPVVVVRIATTTGCIYRVTVTVTIKGRIAVCKHEAQQNGPNSTLGRCLRAQIGHWTMTIFAALRVVIAVMVTFHLLRESARR
jgi:hypothetical protein